jgi:hypothetical protein
MTRGIYDLRFTIGDIVITLTRAGAQGVRRL